MSSLRILLRLLLFHFPLALSSMALAGSLPGNNVALNKPITPHSTTQRGLPSEAVDGTIFTLWYSLYSSEPEYECNNCIRFTVDLEGQFNIQTIAVYVAQTWRVRISSSLDGIQWVERATRDWGGSYGGAARFDFPAGFQARYLKYEGDANWYQWVGVTEFEVYDETPLPLPPFGERNLSLEASAEIFDTGCSAATPPANALDGDPNTTWKPSCKADSDATENWQTWGYIEIDLGEIYNLGKIIVKPVSFQFAYFSLSARRDPNFEGGYDHSFIAFDGLVSSGGTTSQEGIALFLNVPARFIRLHTVNFEVRENDLVEIAEIEIYEAVDHANVLLGPVAAQRWTRSIRVDSNGNGYPDAEDETIDVIREPASMNYVTFVSPRWGTTTLELGNPDSRTGDFSTLIHRRPQSAVMTALGRSTNWPQQESTTTQVTIFNLGQLDETLRPGGLSFERTKVRRGEATVRSGRGSTTNNGFEFKRDDQPKVSLNFVYEDVDGDGNADYASIPWAMSQLLGVNSSDATVDPQVWVPLGDTNGDGVPDSPAFDFNLDGRPDANVPLTPAVAGPPIVSSSEYEMGFAQFANGASGPVQFFSELFLVNLNNGQTAQAQVTIRKPPGDPFELGLDGEAFTGNGSFSVPAGGIRLLRTSGTGDLSAGSVRILSDQPLAGVTTYFAAGFGAAGVGASPRLGHGFVAPISRRLSQQIDMGVAILNLEDAETSLKAELFTAEGALLARATSFSLAAYGQTARMLGEFAWDVEAAALDEFDGLLKVSANGDLAGTVLQVSSGEYATMPVVSNLNPGSVVTGVAAGRNGLSPQDDSELLHRLLFAQFANGSAGEAWIRSKIFLFNQEATGAAGVRISIRGTDGNLLPMQINGQPTSGQLEVAVPPNGLRILETGGGDGSFASGSVEVNADRSISGTLIYRSSFGISGVGNSSSWTQGFLGPMQTDQTRLIDSGLAIMNLEDATTQLSFNLYGSEGNLIATAMASLAPRGQMAALLRSFQWTPSSNLDNFTGLIGVDSGGARIAGTIIQLRPGQYLTMPVAPRLN